MEMFTNISVKLSNDPAVNGDLTAVVESAIGEYEKLFTMLPPAGVRPIQVQYDPAKGPLIDSTSNTDIYNILLTVNGRFYNQVVYQLAHELCHITADPRRSNWFTESCCELASLIVLDKLSMVWDIEPPFINWKSYAPTFKQYAQKHIEEMTKVEFQDSRLPDMKRLRTWLFTKADSFKSIPNDRPRNTIIALIMRPVFKEINNCWDTISFLGQASVNTPTSLKDLNGNSDIDFDKWEKVVPEQLKDAVHKMRMFINS